MNLDIQLGLGTAALGRPQYINLRQEKALTQDIDAFKLKGFDILENAYRLGIRYFDTAPGYGLAEELLIEWLHTKKDDSIKIATKWGYTYVGNFESNAKIHEIKEHSLNKLNEQWEISKAFLPHLKVYQIHSATLETGVLENEAILDRLAFLKEEHQLEIGITTTGANQTEVIKKALDVEVNNRPLFDVFQVTFNVLDQSLGHLSERLRQDGKSIIIKEALANGRLFRNDNYKHYNGVYDALERIARRKDVGIDVIALKFCTQTIPNSIVLSGASTNSHLESNIKINEISLTEDELRALKNFGIEADFYWKERKQLLWN